MQRRSSESSQLSLLVLYSAVRLTMTASCDLSSFDQRVGYLAVLRVVTIFDRFFDDRL